MKNLIKALTVVVLITTLFASCNRRKNSIDSSKFNLQSAKAEFYGDQTRENVDTYVLYLYDDKLTSNPDGDGRFIALEMNVEPSNVNEIRPGTYVENASSRAVSLTFQKGQWKRDEQGDYLVGSYVGTYIGSQTQQQPITSGNLKVAQNGNTYTITGVVNADGKSYNVQYRGEIVFDDYVVPLPERLTHGEIWYWGDPDGDGLSIFSIRLGGDDVKISDFSGSDDAMQIELYVPTKYGTTLPDGTYPVKVDVAEAFTTIDGYYDEADNADYGTWYYTADALSINKGFVKVTRDINQGSTYRIDFDLTDDWYGYRIFDYYEGQLAFRDMTTRSNVKPRAAVRSADGANSGTSANTELRGKAKRTTDKRHVRTIERRIDKNTPKAVRVNRK